jgi:hypothetical protein
VGAREEMAAFTGVERGDDAGWVTLPLTTTSGGVRAVLRSCSARTGS